MKKCDNARRIALLSNVTVSLIAKKLSDKYDVWQCNGFDTWVQAIIDLNSDFYQNEFDAVILLIDGTEARTWRNIEEAKERIMIWENALSVLSSNVNSKPIFVSTIDIRENRIKSLTERKNKYEFENNWYQFIQSIAEGKRNVGVWDLADTIADYGRNAFYSNKIWYMSSMPYSKEGLDVVCKEIKNLLNTVFEMRKKALILDLDNTLWGGVVGEDGIDGIELSNHNEGQRYFDFQYQIAEMKKRGILLGINSKNNENDIETVLESHPGMILRNSDFAIKKVNWNNKADNIKEIAKELNILENGFVFIDDSPIERSIVKGECDGIIVPDFPNDSSELLMFAESIWNDYMRPFRVLNEDLKKTEMYQAEALRRNEKDSSLNLDEYIKRLEICLDIHKMRDNERERVAQLINKTNQFNLTTKRYTLAEIEKMSESSEYCIYVACLSDKYGDSGLVSTLVLKMENEKVYIDTFLMSCRVMGRRVEDVFIDEILAYYIGKLFRAEYIPTEKNRPVEELYDRLGFELAMKEKS